jgi:hypothetical protein
MSAITESLASRERLAMHAARSLSIGKIGAFRKIFQLQTDINIVAEKFLDLEADREQK